MGLDYFNAYRKAHPEASGVSDDDLTRGLHRDYVARTGDLVSLESFAEQVKAFPSMGEVVKSLPRRFMGGAQQAIGGIITGLNELQNPVRTPAVAKETIGKIGAGIQESGTRNIQEATPENAENLPTFSARNMLLQGVPSVGFMAPNLVAPGGLAGKLTSIGVSSGGVGFEEAKAAGLSDQAAHIVGALKGSIEAGTEAIPLKVFFKNAGKPVMKQALEFVFKEAPQELIAETLNSVVDKLSTQPDMTWGEFAGRMQQTLAALPVAVAGTGGLGYVAANTQRFADQAQQNLDKPGPGPMGRQGGQLSLGAQDDGSQENLTEAQIQADQTLGQQAAFAGQRGSIDLKPPEEETDYTGELPRVPPEILSKVQVPRPEDTPLPLTDPDRSNKYAGSINLDKLQSPEDVKDVIRIIADTQEPAITEARRGQVSWEETEKLAKAAGVSPQKIMERAMGEAWNAQQIEAGRALLEQSAERVRNLALEAKATQDAQTKAAAHKAILQHTLIQAQYSAIATEAGRALNILKKTSSRVKNYGELLEQFPDKLDTVIDMVSEAETAGQVSQVVREAEKAGTVDKLLEIWINMLLSGPQTHAVNMLSNTLVNGIVQAEEVIAAGIGKLHPGNKVRGREALSYVMGTVRGGVEAAHLAKEVFVSEEEAFNTKIEARRYRAIGGPVGKAVRLPGRLLMTEDAIFKAIGFRQHLNALSMKQAIDEGLRGRALRDRAKELRDNPTNELYNKAKQRAEYVTFTNELGPLGKAIQKIANQYAPIKLIIPFVRTPSNIIKFAAERSPAAPLFKQYRDNLTGKNGGEAADRAYARLVSGSSMMASALWLASQGLLTGGEPEDARERAVWRAAGMQPYSLKLGDVWHKFGRLEPSGILLGVAGDIWNIRKYATNDELGELAALISASVANNLTSKTYLRGISEAIKAADDPTRYAYGYIKGFAGTVIPTGVSQLAQTQDPFMRRSDTVLDRIQSRVPALREELLLRRDDIGRPIERDEALGPDIMSPVRTKSAQGDPVAQELLRIETYPPMPIKKIGEVELTPAQQDEWLQLAGTIMRRELENEFKTPGYRRESLFVQQRIAKKIISAARREATGELLVRYPGIVDQRTTLREALASGG